MGKFMTPQQIVDEAAKDILFFKNSNGGLTLSGGECMLHPEYIESILRLCHEQKIHSVIDTCGHVPWQNFEYVLNFADMFLYDIKKMDTEKHKEYTGSGNELILENIEKLCAKNMQVIIRIPLIPGYTDSKDDIMATGNFIIQKLHRRIVRVELLPYNRLAESKYTNNTTYRDGGIGKYPLPELLPQSKEYVDELCKVLTDMDIDTFAEIA
jgi:pyruvate formate lyase activating enzyme